MSIEQEIRSQYLRVIEDAEVTVGTRLPRFRGAVFSFPSDERLGPQNPNFFLLPGLSGKPYWSLDDLPSVVREQLNWVQTEFERIKQDYLAGLPTMGLSRGRTGYFGHTSDWTHHDLVLKGGKIAAGIEELNPALYRFCHRLLDEVYLSGTFFALMSPGCHLKTHCGAFNHALRLHLGLVIPPGDCALVVNGEAKSWNDGEWLCFDDTFPHEAWNRTALGRHILLARLLHPELSKEERRAYLVIEENPLFWRTYTEFKRHYLHNA